MATLIELILVLFSSFGFGLIPFAGPSNLLLASNAAVLLGDVDPATLIGIGFLVAVGSALAKSIHYMVTFFVSAHLSERRRERLDADAKKVKRWAFLLLYVAAATPIPDEPVVIPLGLMKYNPVKFFTAFFLGKLSITVVGAFLGSWSGKALSEYLSFDGMIVLSVVLTIIITVILLKVDMNKLAEKIGSKLQKGKTKTTKQGDTSPSKLDKPN
jgi:membrane protein YqaA with SNARE-associated domain